MEYWEFLLQKEGDQSWLPLDASQVEILEGRYRVMAHTSQANTPVQIHISQRLLDQQPPQQRRLRRQGATNENGLMVVMPFTRLGEGTWDILCAGGAEPDGEGEGAWRYAVQLRVVAQGADDGDWFADDGSAGLGPLAPGRLGGGSFEQPEPPPVDLAVAAAALDGFQAQLSAGLGESASDYQLELPQTALLASEGETLELPVTVMGTPDAGGMPALTLVVRLSDPQTAATVALVPVALGTATLPASASLAIALPPRLSTRLLLGEVGLLAAEAVLALQRFTVTVDVAALFDAIANQAEADGDLGLVFPAEDLEALDALGASDDASAPGPRDLKTWDIAGRGAPPREMPILTLPRSSPELPPKIYYPSPHEVAVHQPSLPPVGRPKPPSASPAPQADPTSPQPNGANSPPDPASPTPPRGLSLPPIAQPPRSEDPIAILQGQVPPPPPGKKPPEPQLISHEAMGFKDLNLQDRFWHRLNELAVNLQQEARETRAAAVEPMAAATTASTADAAAEPGAEFIPFAGEVVIYADEDPTLSRPPVPPPVAAPAEAEAEPITPPVPSLELPEGDLVAGEPVVLTLRVPFHPNRLYLKVWITDPQTRTLADEPRQLMNLLPNGQGQLEGTLQLTVPLGCLEAWFEAIAIDLVTQQESYKTSVSRAITPAGLSSSSLDEFEL